MSPIWFLSAAIFILVIFGLGRLPILGRDFRRAAAVLALFGLIATFRGGVAPWHLFWYTPASLIAAYFFALRHLLALSRRLDEIEQDPPTDVASLQSRVEQAVQEYDETVDEERRLR